MDIYVPNPFTKERPAVTYTHQTFDINIEDHPLAKSYPKATNNPSIQLGPEYFRSFAARKDAPETIEDFIYQDIPQLSLHITSFNNATLVALSWPHTLMDALSRKALIHNWSLVLAGKESEVSSVLGTKEDALDLAINESIENKNEEELKLRKYRLKGLNMIIFGLRFIWDLFLVSIS